MPRARHRLVSACPSCVQERRPPFGLHLLDAFDQEVLHVFARDAKRHRQFVAQESLGQIEVLLVCGRDLAPGAFAAHGALVHGLHDGDQVFGREGLQAPVVLFPDPPLQHRGRVRAEFEGVFVDAVGVRDGVDERERLLFGHDGAQSGEMRLFGRDEQLEGVLEQRVQFQIVLAVVIVFAHGSHLADVVAGRRRGIPVRT